MRGYACSNCGAKPNEKLNPPTTTKKLCRVCGKPLTVKMSTTETMVIAKIAAQTRKRKSEAG